jgi:hypothetical protein
MKVKKSDVGRLCLARWDDIGRVECMIVDVNRAVLDRDIHVYDFSSRQLKVLDRSQIVELGKFVTPNNLVPEIH